MKKVYKEEDKANGEVRYFFYCDGCNCTHSVITNPKRWTFNGNEEKPTFSPSILVRWVSLPKDLEKDDKGNYVLGTDGRIKGAKDEVCHSFVTDGKIRYLNDCTHHLKGKTVELEDF